MRAADRLKARKVLFSGTNCTGFSGFCPSIPLKALALPRFPGLKEFERAGEWKIFQTVKSELEYKDGILWWISVFIVFRFWRGRGAEKWDAETMNRI